MELEVGELMLVAMLVVQEPQVGVIRKLFQVLVVLGEQVVEVEIVTMVLEMEQLEEQLVR